MRLFAAGGLDSTGWNKVLERLPHFTVNSLPCNNYFTICRSGSSWTVNVVVNLYFCLMLTSVFCVTDFQQAVDMLFSPICHRELSCYHKRFGCKNTDSILLPCTCTTIVLKTDWKRLQTWSLSLKKTRSLHTLAIILIAPWPPTNAPYCNCCVSEADRYGVKFTSALTSEATRARSLYLWPTNREFLRCLQSHLHLYPI